VISKVFLLKNQGNEFLDKSGEWVAADNAKNLYRTAYKDEALNKKVEFSVKNFELRISIFETTIDANNKLDLGDNLPNQTSLNIDSTISNSSDAEPTSSKVNIEADGTEDGAELEYTVAATTQEGAVEMTSERESTAKVTALAEENHPAQQLQDNTDPAANRPMRARS